MRHSCNLGPRQLQGELLNLHSSSLATASIYKVLRKHHIKAVKHIRKKLRYTYYKQPVPGERVQMDTTKIAPGIYQYTSVDDCARYRSLRPISKDSS